MTLISRYYYLFILKNNSIIKLIIGKISVMGYAVTRLHEMLNKCQKNKSLEVFRGLNGNIATCKKISRDLAIQNAFSKVVLVGLHDRYHAYVREEYEDDDELNDYSMLENCLYVRDVDEVTKIINYFYLLNYIILIYKLTIK